MLCYTRGIVDTKFYKDLEKINSRPEPFEFYTADDLWTDEHTSKKMLEFHLNGDVDLSSRNTAFLERSSEWIASHFGIGSETRIADFGCGPGHYTSRLAKYSDNVTGIDFSPRSIEYATDAATQQGLKIDYVNRNYLEYRSDKRFDLIIMIMCDFCALSPDQRSKLLGIFREHLDPGGSVLLDVYSLAAFDKRQEARSYDLNFMNGFWSDDKYYGFLNTFRYDTEKVFLDKYTIITESETRIVYNWLQYFSGESLAGEFEGSGFTIESYMGNVAGAPYDENSDEFAVIAKI